MVNVEGFRNRILDAGVLDPEGQHHEFVSGLHGRKLDFDKVQSGTVLYDEWTSITAEYIIQQYPAIPDALLGVANGTNRLARDIAPRLGHNIVGLYSRKDTQDSKILQLSDLALKYMEELEPELVIVVEDVGTTGSNSVQVAEQSLKAGAKNVEVVITWQRQPYLEKLEKAGIPYRALIREDLPSYTPQSCRAEGYCSKGWKYIPR
jgi:orotate phosphoribosyltransferase